MGPKRKLFLIVAGALFLIVLAIVAFLLLGKNLNKPQTSFPQNKKLAQTESKWQENGVVVAGQYADAEVVDLGNGRYRMYYSIEPEVPGNNLEIYSSTSTDGTNWTKEKGTRKEMA